MAQRIELNQSVLSSVFDRLIDDDPGATREVVKTGPQAVRELMHAVRRDLENLLNTRRSLHQVPDDLTELKTSLVNYGLPDFTSLQMNSAHDVEAFLKNVVDTIHRFEPRLENVRVDLLPNPESSDRVMRFRIDAILHVHPFSDGVSFNSSFEPARGGFKVS